LSASEATEQNMTRAGPGEAITVKPTNNIYTVLAGIALLLAVIALVALYLRGDTLGINLLK
jgi:hypothetical protein